jgi:CDP-diacylglycerol---glycerol-3-phosphate 3-phosphatidyltransferase
MKKVPDHASDAPTSASLWNIANALTCVRIIAVPFLAWLLIEDTDQSRNLAALVFVAASVTDFLDGAVARKYGLITVFGKVADPIADKLLTGVALIGLSILGLLPWWITIVIVIREIAVTIIRFWVIEHGVIVASRGGKAKTLAQTIAITMYLIAIPASWVYLDFWNGAKVVAMTIALILTLVTAISYIQRALDIRRNMRGKVIR